MKQGIGLKRVGILSKEDRKTSQGYVELKKMTAEQLDELIERQKKLLKNRSFIAKLPDKGAKIISFKAQLEAEQKRRQEEYDSACQLLNDLTLNEAPEDIEWNEGLPKNQSQRDSDDESEEETDPLKLVATHSGTAKGAKIKISETNKPKLYVDKFCEKFGTGNEVKERFKPNQLKDNNKSLFVESAEKVKQRLGDKWEVTEATPPVPVYKNTVMISLPESLALQREQAEKLKEIEKKNATERLLQNLKIRMGDKLPVNNITEYRSGKNVFDESVVDEEGEEECVDSEGEDKDENRNLKPLTRSQAVMSHGCSSLTTGIGNLLLLNSEADYTEKCNGFVRPPNFLEHMEEKENHSAPASRSSRRQGKRSVSLHKTGLPTDVTNAVEPESPNAVGETLKCAFLEPDKRKSKRHSKRARSASGSRGRRKLRDEWNSSPKFHHPSPTQSKNSNLSDRRSLGSAASTSASTGSKKSGLRGGPQGAKGTFLDLSECVLATAADEQEKILRAFRETRDELRKKLLEEKSESRSEAFGERPEAEPGTPADGPSAEPRGKFFVNSYNNLDEVFQAWIHLFYFIINLRFNLVRVANVSGKESFIPNAFAEKSIVMQAIECVKFYSKLKMKSVAESLEEIGDPKASESQILEYEDKISSQFLQEMEELGKKARETVPKCDRKIRKMR